MKGTFQEIGEQVWRRPGSGQRLAIVGSIHGDEPAGATIVRELLAGDDRVWRRAGDVDLTLAVGNPRALELGQRSTESGVDMNRIFGAHVERKEAYESSRAACLMELLKEVQVLLDLHQTHCTTPPVAVLDDTPAHLRLAAALGIAHGVVDIERVYQGTMLSRWIDVQGGLGLTVETGQKGSLEALGAAREIARRFLTAGAKESASGGRIRRYRLEESVPTPAHGLTFTRALGNTTQIKKGELLGHHAQGDLRALRDATVFLPRAGGSPGSPCMLLAQDEGVLTV